MTRNQQSILEAQLRDELEKLSEKVSPMAFAVKFYDEEESRGIMHYPEYQHKIHTFKTELQVLRIQQSETWLKLKAIIPPYDPDNHIGGCGCVVKNGERIHWCGDHF